MSNNLEISSSDIWNVIESNVESYFEDNIDQHIHDTIEYNYEILDGDDIINIIHNQWREGEYTEFVKNSITEYSAVDMKEVEKLIDARHEEDTATSTALYDQVQVLTQRVDELTEMVRVITNAYAQVVDYVRK